MRRKYKKRLPKREKKPLVILQNFTQSWSIDFTLVMSWRMVVNSEVSNVIDDYNREVLLLKSTQP